MKKYRVGIVGVGKIAQTYFSVFQRMKTVEVVFLCDIVPEQMTKAVRAFPELLKNALQTDSTDKIFDAGVKVDSVVVATPLSSHFFLAQRVLRRGVCVFLEKPATPTVRELEELYALADANGTHFRTMFHYAYSPEVFHFSQLFPKWSETLGPLRAFVCDFLDAAVSGNRLVIANYLALNRVINRFIRDVRRRIQEESQEDYEKFQDVHRKLVESVLEGNCEMGRNALEEHFVFITKDFDT